MARFEQPACHTPHNLLEAMILEGPVVDLRTGVLSQTDQEHLEQAALDGAGKLRMGLYPAAEQHVVGLEGIPIGVDGKSLRGLAHDHRFQTRSNWATAPRFGNAVPLDNLLLPLRRSPAMTAHRREDKRFGTRLAEDLHHRPQDAIDVGDAATTRRDRHTLPWAYLHIEA